MRNTTSELQHHFESKSREIDEPQEQLQLERQRALTDPLTGLYNRLALIDRLNAAVAEMPNGQPPPVIMLDIDHFKLINDTHGHLIGDRVIRLRVAGAAEEHQGPGRCTLWWRGIHRAAAGHGIKGASRRGIDPYGGRQRTAGARRQQKAIK